jgi:hypothetical protein
LLKASLPQVGTTSDFPLMAEHAGFQAEAIVATVILKSAV